MNDAINADDDDLYRAAAAAEWARREGLTSAGRVRTRRSGLGAGVGELHTADRFVVAAHRSRNVAATTHNGQPTDSCRAERTYPMNTRTYRGVVVRNAGFGQPRDVHFLCVGQCLFGQDDADFAGVGAGEREDEFHGRGLQARSMMLRMMCSLP